MKREKQFLGYILRYFNGDYYVSHTRPHPSQIDLVTSNSFFEAHLLSDKQSVKELLEDLDEYIDEKGFELLRFSKRGTNHFLHPATNEDLERLLIPSWDE